jgi:hypothetical protein
MNIEFQHVILAIVTFFLGCVVTYSRAYAKKAAETDRDREVVEEITAKIESTKLTFLKELETVKADLVASNNLRQGISTGTRDAIYNFIEVYYSWLHESQKVYFTEHTVETLDNINNKYAEGRKDYLIATERLLIFFNDALLEDTLEQIKALTKRISVLSVTCFKEQHDFDYKMNQLDRDSLTYFKDLQTIQTERLKAQGLIQDRQKDILQNDLKPILNTLRVTFKDLLNKS